MPFLQIIIKNNVTDEIKLEWSSLVLEERVKEVNSARDYLKYKYRQTIALYPENWNIVIVGVESSMNEKVKV